MELPQGEMGSVGAASAATSASQEQVSFLFIHTHHLTSLHVSFDSVWDGEWCQIY